MNATLYLHPTAGATDVAILEGYGYRAEWRGRHVVMVRKAREHRWSAGRSLADVIRQERKS